MKGMLTIGLFGATSSNFHVTLYVALYCKNYENKENHKPLNS